MFLILFVINFTNNIRDEYQDFIVESEIDHLCLLVKGAVAKVYVTGNIPGRYNDTLGSINIGMPEKIGDTKYRASFNGSSVMIETFFNPRRNVTCMIGLPGAYRGFSAGGQTKITLYQYVNGTKAIEMSNI
ncbi:MAG: hypothetical protein HYW27_01440 [Candidatus Aenigmarchaeota archaeon]|nr:hypothetical protein [Candidatus Aenigmarchaeota archaeon]